MIPSIRRVAGGLDQRQVLGVGLALDPAAAGVVGHGLGQQADQPGRAAVVGGHRQVQRQHAVAEDPLADRDRLVEVGPVLVQLGDHHRARHADGRALLPQHPGRAVDAVDRADHEQRRVGGAQPGPQVADEVGVAGGVEQVDLDAACTTGANESETERCWRCSASSKSLTVVPSSTRPARGMVPVATSSASTSVVFPAPEWPTSTTLRTDPGWSAAGAAPAAPALLVWTISTASATSVVDSVRRVAGAPERLAAFTREPPSHKGPTGLA